ncbi:peptidoglycan synthetase FtsI [Mariprofundus ferrinatatus]|uniref:Peptidoglycan synthetase FtsI n=1 Tax=Mariprofundus ferrinatatus TaxID=1921087 RepID=A0A2K8LCR7_9PROT|nr:penicillin-binding transpeptidase domain-containing protein [Mariprofundus ferrinatatus]ATX82694.1 peptidoglycan synthetase FtsI [Mariprofundus ferrinatatus]
MSDKQKVYVRRRIEAVAGLLGLGLLMLVVRAVDLQVLQADYLTSLAEKQHYRQYTAVAPRGPILDSKGRTLAESIEIPSIAAMADEVPEGRVGELARALGLSTSKVKRKLERSRGFVWLARQVPPSVADKVMALDIPGVRREREWRRYHPLGPETGHLLGFVGVDGKGLEGIERSWNKALTGEAGIRQVRRDARGHSLPDGVWVREATAGESIQLTVDASIQSIAYAALAEGVRSQNAKGGSVVVMRPSDGAVLAMANWPGYNPNNFRHFKPGQWRNRAVTDVFEPGSTMKPFSVAAALASGKWQPDSIVYCEKGAMQVADYTIHDDHPEGWLDLTGIVVKSSNIGVAKLALDIGPDPVYEMLRRAGFGQRSHMGLGGESPGIVLPPERWGPVETANIAFGQGIAVTPLQLAAAFSVLANEGLYVAPKLLKSGAPAAAEENHRVMDASVARQVVSMLEYATSEDGTGSKAVPAGYRVAGKTGTAQKPDEHGRYSKGKYTAVFAGLAPVDNPQLVIVVVVDEPQKSMYGGQVAAPVFRHVAESALPYLGVPAQINNQGQWQTIEAAAEPPVFAAESAYGMSMREVRRFAAERGLRLHVHGSGWVSRQKPANVAALSSGDGLEVWLNE